MYKQVPFTNVLVNEFGICCYTDFNGKKRCDTGYPNKCGYRLIKVSCNKFYYIHRLVARCFCENPAPAYFNVVHHKDGNRQNNIPENLEWTNKQMNNAQKKNSSLVKKTRKGFRPQFIFNKTLHRTDRVYESKEEALVKATEMKNQLINETREYIIRCARTGKCPNKQLNCPACGFAFDDSSVCGHA